MPNIKQAKKRVIQSEKARLRNKSRTSRLHTLFKKVELALTNQDLEAAKKAYVKLVPFLDRVAHQDLIHKNKAARHKSRLNTQIKKLTTKS